MSNVLVIGGGAAGMLAAIFAARGGAKVTLWEKNDRLGKKLRITGKGRCNITNAGDQEDIINNLIGNGRFLFSALNGFSNKDTMAFFEAIGVPLKIERGQRVFPVSDQAITVIDALEKELKRQRVLIQYNISACNLVTKEGRITGAKSRDGFFPFDKVILATGGCTYQGTGSTGDGYGLVKAIGHTVTELYPALIPLVAKEPWHKDLSGLSLKNVALELWSLKASATSNDPSCPLQKDKKLAGGFGEMLFTHFGLSGPVILALSENACKYWQKNKGKSLLTTINLKPALTKEQLDLRLQRDFEKYSRKHFMNGLGDLLPKSFIPIIIQLSNIPPELPIHQITKEQRHGLLDLLQGFPVEITGTRPLDEGIVTAGGISLKEINPKTFESKLVSGLYAVGEVLDIHGYTGGYNLQAAFSAGFVAGTHSAGLK